ncbi:membrane protein [Streptomyces sp. 150FB]|uniref:VanZ family protein n=1 Tax=Streptomyces sp. 150FB TaxID=1576605 RepID=UPI000588ECBF|nr:VanZ family protein [Streptomyces sp. 150FB]KIF76392.1 membrane protein [Streptomyces sp. 150FB]
MRQGPGGCAVIRFRFAGIVLLLLHLLLVGWLSLRPLDVMWVTAANLTPFAGIRADLAMGTVEAVRRIGEGLLLLAPLGVLLPMAGGRLTVSPCLSMVRTVAAGALISLGIELLQTGVPGQVVDVDSLWLNTAGVAIAHLLVVPAGRARMRRKRREAHAQRPSGTSEGHDSVPWVETSQGSTPTIPRVGVAP